MSTTWWMQSFFRITFFRVISGCGSVTSWPSSSQAGIQKLHIRRIEREPALPPLVVEKAGLTVQELPHILRRELRRRWVGLLECADTVAAPRLREVLRPIGRAAGPFASTCAALRTALHPRCAHRSSAVSGRSTWPLRRDPRSSARLRGSDRSSAARPRDDI